MNTLVAVIRLIAGDVLAATDELNRLDGAAGDGDLGLTAAAAAEAVLAVAPQLEGEDPSAVLKRCGVEIARNAPSTFGTLLATALMRAARVTTDFADPGATLHAMAEAAEVGIQERGKASVGDKTLLDALHPAVQALGAAATRHASLGSALREAAAAAAAGAQSTTTMRPRVGRAGWLADRSVGHVDAGAHLVALLFQSGAARTSTQLSDSDAHAEL